jgi:hypothetical protein
VAIHEIVKHYSGYIMQPAGKEHFNSDGKNYFIVDETKADILKIALIEQITKFCLV